MTKKKEKFIPVDIQDIIHFYRKEGLCEYCDQQNTIHRYKFYKPDLYLEIWICKKCRNSIRQTKPKEWKLEFIGIKDLKLSEFQLL